jgi:hypothetical protein
MTSTPRVRSAEFGLASLLILIDGSVLFGSHLAHGSFDCFRKDAVLHFAVPRCLEVSANAVPKRGSQLARVGLSTTGPSARAPPKGGNCRQCAANELRGSEAGMTTSDKANSVSTNTVPVRAPDAAPVSPSGLLTGIGRVRADGTVAMLVGTLLAGVAAYAWQASGTRTLGSVRFVPR